MGHRSDSREPTSPSTSRRGARAEAGDFTGLLRPRRAEELGPAVDAALRAVWLEIAREHYASLPADAREQIDARIEQLLENPTRVPTLATTSAVTSGPPPTANGAGLIVYAVVHDRQRVIILRLV